MNYLLIFMLVILASVTQYLYLTISEKRARWYICQVSFTNVKFSSNTPKLFSNKQKTLDWIDDRMEYAKSIGYASIDEKYNVNTRNFC